MHWQAITVIESRVKVLENSLGHSGGQPGLSLKLEYTENMDGNNGGNGHTEGMGSLSQSVEALERYPSALFPSFLKLTCSQIPSAPS